MNHAVAFTFAFLCLAHSVFAAERTSETDQRLAQGLKQYPEADTNKDGILTMTEARAYLTSRRGGEGRFKQNETIFVPTAEELDAAIAKGRVMTKEPLAYEKGKGLRLLMTGHSWVAPGRKTLPAIAEAAGYKDHQQRSHTSGGATGAANAIWLKEFGKWMNRAPANPVLLPAVATGEWDVMTWGSFYEDKVEYYSQWIDLCLKHNPYMVFYVQDGWPRFDPEWKSLSKEEIREAVNAEQAEKEANLFTTNYDALEKKYPGKVRMIPASYAVVDLIGQYLDGKIESLDCVDEKSQNGKKGIYRDGGHLSRASGIEHLVGYVYYGMLYKKSPALIESYVPEGVPAEFDRQMRAAAWRAIVDSPFADVDDADGDGVAD
ncbi:MAG: hypothetical protein AAGA58_03800 [Verrucomicrobiota bacterium]